MQQLLLWNNTLYASTLANAFGAENVITGSEEFVAATKQLDKYSSLIVLCELEWSGNGISVNREQLQGIELVKEMRRKHELKIPVLFASFRSLPDIFNAEREILTAIGHDFYHLPAVPQDFKTFITKEFGDRKLSVMELNDIKSFYCSKEGILSHELHYLNHFLNFNITAENHDSTFEELVTVIRKIHDLFLVDSSIAVTAFRVGFSELIKENISDAVNHIVRLGNGLAKKYGENTSNISVTEKAEDNPWKVLFLDDQINEQHELVQLMKKSFDVVCVDNATEAKKVLLKDWKTDNRIMVVVADYRLYENAEGVKRHQKIQGYQFLKEIASTDHLVRLVAFSGLQRKFLLNSFKHYNIRTEVKSKIDYLSSEQTRQLFCDEINDLAEENWEAIEALPNKCAGFERYLKEAYIEFRMHPDYNKMEGNVTLTAKEYVHEIQQQINDGEEIRIGAIDNIKSPLAKTKKDQEAFFKRFQNYLVARRIALWLYASNKKGLKVNVDSRKIAEILTDQPYPSDAYRQILSTNLGLSLDDFPKNITIEERRWLQYEMQINIFRDINLMIPALAKVAKNYKDFFLSNEFLKEQVKKGKFAVAHKYKQTNYSIDFAKDFTPNIKTASDVRVLFLWIAEQCKKAKSKTECVEIIKPLVSRLRHSLFESRNEVVYLKNLFEYFNGYYRILNKEQSSLTNPTAKIKDKSGFEKKSAPALNKSFERVHELLCKEEFPNDNDKADDWNIYITGEKVVAKFGRKILDDKAKFFSELTKAINEESKFIGGGLDEGRTGNQSNDDDDSEDLSDDDFPDFADKGEED